MGWGFGTLQTIHMREIGTRKGDSPSLPSGNDEQLLLDRLPIVLTSVSYARYTNVKNYSHRIRAEAEARYTHIRTLKFQFRRYIFNEMFFLFILTNQQNC